MLKYSVIQCKDIFTFAAVMHGTKTMPESGVMANCMALLVWRRTMSKFTSVLQQDSTSQSLNLESEPIMKQKTTKAQLANHKPNMNCVTSSSNINVKPPIYLIKDGYSNIFDKGWLVVYYFIA